MMGIVGNEKADQQFFETWSFIGIPKGCLDHLPERPVQFELLELHQDKWRCIKVDFFPRLSVRVEKSADDIEQFRLVSFRYNRNHLTVKVRPDVARPRKCLELLETFTIVEEFSPVCYMLAQ